MAVLLTAGSTAAFAAEQTAPVVGDVNGDGAVDVMDATEIQRWLAETRETIDTKAADVNRDGAVDVQDITLIQRYIAEFIPNFDAWAPKELTLDVSELTLEVGQQHALTTSYTPENGAVHFSSGNESVATVDENGVVRAVGAGTATITAASDKGTAAQCSVTVNEAVQAIQLNTTDKVLQAGDSFRLTAQAGGVVTAKKAGTATITATAYNGKSANVTVTVSDGYSATQKTTTAAVGLRKDASWLASNIVILPKGTAVTVFQTSDDGRWMKAQYGDNYGWIYNRALGAGKNYSSINLSTLPAVADDLVFDLNLNKRRIYNYVYDIGYRNTGNDTTENLCVDALRYGTGSCYHHAALLNYLYNRCGYETITVTGVDYLTGGSDHGWCLSKTSEGWRHVDAQMIIGFDNSNQYFVTDSHISQFFGWNRNGVPAAV